jgi:hypothetical protein
MWLDNRGMDTPSTPDSAPTPSASRWWLRPLPLTLLVTAALLLWASWPLLNALLGPPPASRPATGLPWQVETDGRHHSSVFGLHLNESSLADVQAHFPSDLSVAVVVSRQKAPALEAYVDSFRAGFITGKLVLAFDADSTWLERVPSRATSHEVGEGGRSARYKLSADDLAQASSARLVALSFVPSARLDEDVVRQRFGTPSERLTGSDGELQLLYAASGVAVALPPAQGDGAKTKSLIQYVAPGQFEARLRAPLRAASAP